MDHYTARWMMVKKLSLKQLSELHALENAESDWLVAGACFMADATRSAPFWVKNKPNDERSAEVEEFLKRVQPIRDKHFAEYKKGSITEREAVHRIDKEVWGNQSVRINYGPMDGGNRELEKVYGKPHQD